MVILILCIVQEIHCCHFVLIVQSVMDSVMLLLQYGDKWHKSLATKEQAKEGGLSIWEAECCLDAELFLDEYPQWDVGGLHCPFIF